VSEARTINLRSYTDGTKDNIGNVTIEKIGYTWKTGKSFEESNPLFINIKTYVFSLEAPTLSLPTNNSDVLSLPVVLSWSTPTIPEGYNLSYFVYGDDTTASTFLGAVTQPQYLWWGLSSGTYYWKVKAGIEGQNSSFTDTWQFDLDLCAPDSDYSYALDYPMSYDNTTDTITIWGSNGSDNYAAMGSNSSVPITFANLFEFGRAKRGICAVTNPASGSYAVLTNLDVGNTTSELNLTYLKTSGESISFNKQVKLNTNSHFTSGLLSNETNPYSASTLSFSGTTNVSSEEGLLYMLPGSYLEFYDSLLTHTISPNQSNLNPWSLYWNGQVTAKRSSFENWWTIRFRNSNNTLEDIVMTNIGQGFYPTITQVGNLNTIKPRKITQEGVYFYNDTEITIEGLEITETEGEDISVINYTGIATLLNPSVNWSSINWTTGTYSGQINRKHTYDISVTDSVGNALANTTIVLIDKWGNVLFGLTTDSAGQISQQEITRAIYDYSHKSGNDQGPHRLYLKKYGKSFQTVAKEFSAATIETAQLATNTFSTLSESGVSALTNIQYTEPSWVQYGTESNASVTTSMTLAHSPIDQCQYYAIFANGTKLVEGTNYTLNYETGAVTFPAVTNMTGYNVTPTYYYGGNLSITNGITVSNAFTMSNLYDYMQYASATTNLSQELTTVNGVTYTFCIDLLVGNETAGGSLQDAGKTIEFEEGYDVVVGDGGALIDLAGVGGTGLIGAIEISKAQIKEGEWQTVFVSLSDNLGNPVTGRTIYGMTHYPNGSVWLDNTVFTEIGIYGLYKYEFQIPIDHSPYGAYAVHITSTGINEVRTFEYIPLADIVIKGAKELNTDYFTWFNAKVWDDGSLIETEGRVVNNLDILRVLSQNDLYTRNFFVSLPSQFNSEISSWYASEITEEIIIENFTNGNISAWTYSGNITNISGNCEIYNVGGCAMNITINLTDGGNAILSRNFTRLNMTYDWDTEEANTDITINLPENYLDSIDRILVKHKTTENDYFLENRTIYQWGIWTYGWQFLEPYYDSDKSEEIGNPDSDNITNIEIEIIGKSDYTGIIEVDLASIKYKRYAYFDSAHTGTKSVGDYYNLFWWNGDGMYTLQPNEKRAFLVGSASPFYAEAVQWLAQYPNDPYIVEKTNGIFEARFYWEQLALEKEIKNYLLGNPGRFFFVLSSIGSEYHKSDTANLEIITYDHIGNLVTGSISVNITYPNSSVLTSGSPTELETGRYNYTFIIPSSAPEGDYLVRINANYSGYNASDIKVFSVSNASSSGTGGLPLNIMSGVGSTYEPGDTVYVVSTAINSEGALVNATVNISLYYPNNSLMSSGQAIQTSEGRTKYNYSLAGSAPEGTYTIEVDANYSGNEVHESLVFMVASGVGSSAQPYVNVGVTPDIADINQSVSVIASTYSSLGNLVNCDDGAAVSIRDTIRGTYVVSDEAMTKFETGRYNYTWNPTNTSNYLVTVVCAISGDTSYGEDVFSVTRGFSADLLDIGEVATGNDYKTILRIYNSYGLLIDADATPTITLVDPNNNTIVPSAVMTKESTGTYTYSFATTGYTAGNWKTTANLTVDGVVYYVSESWELESTYADVSPPTITDNTIPTISATSYISNNGTAGSDFEIVYCIVETPENTCGGTDDISIATKTEYFLSKELKLVSLTGLNVSNVGSYYFRVQVRPISATETAFGLSSFTVVSAEVPVCGDGTCNGAETCSSCSTDCGACATAGGGGGGGGVAPITPSIIEEEEEIPAEPYVFQLEVRVLPKYSEVFVGEEVVADIKIKSVGTETEVVNGNLEYFIEDSKGNTFNLKKESVSFTGEKKVLAELSVPDYLKAGDYWIVAKFNYENKDAVGNGKFRVVEKEEAPLGPCCLFGICWFKFIVCWYWWLFVFFIALAILLVSLILRMRKKKRRVYARPERRVIRSLKELENLRRRGIREEIQHKKHKEKLLQHLLSKRKKTLKKKQDLNKLISYIKKEI